MALEMTNLRLLAVPHGGPPGWEVSMLKVRGTEILQEISELQMDVAGAMALEVASSEATRTPGAAASAKYLNLRKLSIFGGSNEIQRNIIAQQIMGG